MIQLWRLLKWALKVAIFFTLFAFALNNQQEATVHFFFGTHWSGSMVLIVLLAFTMGLAVGVLAMVPRWWRNRNAHGALSTPTDANLSGSPLTRPPHGL